MLNTLNSYRFKFIFPSNVDSFYIQKPFQTSFPSGPTFNFFLSHFLSILWSKEFFIFCKFILKLSYLSQFSQSILSTFESFTFLSTCLQSTIYILYCSFMFNLFLLTFTFSVTLMS